VSLRDWLKNGWLIEHQTSPQEIADLLGVVKRDLADCRTSGLSSDWRLSIAYNAALQAAAAALAAAGYRAAREAHHYRVIQSLAHTIWSRRWPGYAIGQIPHEAQYRRLRASGHGVGKRSERDNAAGRKAVSRRDEMAPQESSGVNGGVTCARA
jgi:hypothetical protein